MNNERIRVLLIEDDLVDRMAFSRFVESRKLPYEYTMVDSAHAARQRLTSEQFDIVLSDYSLGDGTCLELLNEHKEIPFIVVTGTGSEEIAVQAMKRGARDYLIKDPGGHYLTVLPSTVKNVLERCAAEADLKRYREHLEEMVQERTAELTAEIRERKRVEAEREALMKEVAQKNRELESILYAASHDLTSPLVSIVGFSRDLEAACQELIHDLHRENAPEGLRRVVSPILDKRIPTALHFIVDNGRKMDVLIHGLLRLSSMGKEGLRCEQLCPDRMLPEILDSLAFQVEKARATVEVASLPDCYGDAAQIDQVFWHLLDNALKYSDPSRPLSIRVTGRVEGSEVIYCVEDSGTGIAPQHQGQIWKLFHRLDPEGPVPGEGLGLTVAHRIVERHEGRMWVESEVGRGSRCGSAHTPCLMLRRPGLWLAEGFAAEAGCRPKPPPA